MKDWSKKSDEWLVDVLKGNDQEDINDAMLVLQDRFNTKITKFLNQKLHPDKKLVEDVTQEIWLAFFRSIKEGKAPIEIGIGNYLFGITRNKRADAVDRMVTERKIEINEPLFEVTSKMTHQVNKRPVEDIVTGAEHIKETSLFLSRIPLAKSLLTGCQRVLWVLRENLGYPMPTIANLTNKNKQTVYSALYYARKRVKNYIRRIEDPLNPVDEEPGGINPIYSRAIDGYTRDLITLERFSNPVIPRLNNSELKPLGLTWEKFRTNYSSSFLLPWYARNNRLEPGPIYLILTERSQWEYMSEYRHIKNMVIRLWLANLYRNDPFRAFSILESYYSDTTVPGLAIISLFNEYETLYDTDMVADVMLKVSGKMPEGYIMRIAVDNEDIILEDPKSIQINPGSPELIHISYHKNGEIAPLKFT